MRGFLVGTLALIVLDVLLQPGAADRAGAGATGLTGAFRAALSPTTPGIPDFAHSQGG